MTDIFKFDSYKKYLSDLIDHEPKLRGGAARGGQRRMAEILRIHPTRLSHILRRDGLNLSLEQATQIAEHLGLKDLEIDYFFALIHCERAGSHALRSQLERQVSSIRARAQSLRERVGKSTVLSSEQQMTFYSDWSYSAVRLAADLPANKSIDDVARYLGISLRRARTLFDFLLSTGLTRIEGDEVHLGKMRTHLAADSPLIAKHHANWRLKAMERHAHLGPRDLCYSAPMSISTHLLEQLRERLFTLIRELNESVANDGPADSVACLNIDLFLLDND